MVMSLTLESGILGLTDNEELITVKKLFSSFVVALCSEMSFTDYRIALSIAVKLI